MSVDVNSAAEITELVSSSSSSSQTTLESPEELHKTQFEDILRQEVILVPEDMEDIHIQAQTSGASADVTASTTCDTTATTATTTATTDTTDAHADADADDAPANNTRNGNGQGKGKHWKRNLKKKQQIEQHATERTQEQRREQIRPIIEKLTELQMNVSYPAIRELYKVLNQFVKTGEDTKIKIPFPEFSRKIKGELSNAPYIPCWVKLEMD